MGDDRGFPSTGGEHADGPSFEEHLESSALALRDALAALVREVGLDTSVPLRLSKALRVDKSLAWKICRVIDERDPIQLVRYVPGSSGLEIFLNAVVEAGASDGAVDGGRAAIAGFDRMVEVHAGDRATLQTMLHGTARDAELRRQASLRKLAFQGNSATLGVQARVHLRVGVIAPNADDPSLFDEAVSVGLVGLRRLRPGVRWPIAVRDVTLDAEGRRIRGRPIDEEGGEDPPFVPEFCSSPMPRIGLHQMADGTILYELEPGPVGNTGAVTCVLATHLRAIRERQDSSAGRWRDHQLRLVTPVELVVGDLFVHRSMRAASPEPIVFSAAAGVLSPEALGRGGTRLPLPERIRTLNGAPAIEGVDWYGRLVGRLFERMGWAASEFECYRIEIEYPPIPASLVMREHLPRT